MLYNPTDGIICTAYFDLGAGAIALAIGSGDCGMEAWGRYWRPWISGTATVPGTALYVRLRNSAGATTYQGDGTSGMHLALAQVEPTNRPSSPIPTATGVVTRGADANSLPLASVPGWSTTEGTLFISFRPLGATQTGNLISLHDGSASNFLRLLISGGALSYDVAAGGSSQATLSGGAVAPGESKRVAVTWRNGAFVISASAAAPVVSASGVVPSGLATLGIGGFASFSGYFGHIERVVAWSRAVGTDTLPLLSA